MTRAARQASVVAVYPAETGLKSIRQVMEGALDAELDISGNSRVGGACACVIDVEVPNGLRAGAAWRRIERELPAVRIKTMKRFRESWWARHNWAIATGVAAGVVVDHLCDSVGRLAQHAAA